MRSGEFTDAPAIVGKPQAEPNVGLTTRSQTCPDDLAGQNSVEGQGSQSGNDNSHGKVVNVVKGKSCTQKRLGELRSSLFVRQTLYKLCALHYERRFGFVVVPSIMLTAMASVVAASSPTDELPRAHRILIACCNVIAAALISIMSLFKFQSKMTEFYMYCQQFDSMVASISFLYRYLDPGRLSAKEVDACINRIENEIVSVRSSSSAIPLFLHARALMQEQTIKAAHTQIYSLTGRNPEQAWPVSEDIPGDVEEEAVPPSKQDIESLQTLHQDLATHQIVFMTCGQHYAFLYHLFIVPNILLTSVNSIIVAIWPEDSEEILKILTAYLSAASTLITSIAAVYKYQTKMDAFFKASSAIDGLVAQVKHITNSAKNSHAVTRNDIFEFVQTVQKDMVDLRATTPPIPLTLELKGLDSVCHLYRASRQRRKDTE